MGINSNKYLRILCRPIIWATGMFGQHYPATLVKLRYFVRFHKLLNLKSPQTLNEKILYLSLRTDTSLWTELSDKWKVREYIKDCGLSDILVQLYGVWPKVENIEFDKLPDSFILKTNHGSGDAIIVNDKNQINRSDIIISLSKSLSTRYGNLEGGKHYMRIKPVVIAEQLLINDDVSKQFSSSIIDYKIWCFNGKAYYIWTCCNRDKNGADVMTYDIDWQPHPEYSRFYAHYRRGQIIPKPGNYDEMISVAERLAKLFPVVRVDLYNIGNKIYFGEMTFTSLGGLMDFYTDEFQIKAGNIIDLNYGES